MQLYFVQSSGKVSTKVRDRANAPAVLITILPALCYTDLAKEVYRNATQREAAFWEEFNAERDARKETAERMDQTAWNMAELHAQIALDREVSSQIGTNLTLGWLTQHLAAVPIYEDDHGGSPLARSRGCRHPSISC